MKRTWDESKSPQWRYLLGKESELRKATKRIFRGDVHGEDTTDGGEIKRNKRGKKEQRNRNAKNNTQQQKQFTKLGKEIVYSASPGPQQPLSKKNDNDDNQ